MASGATWSKEEILKLIDVWGDDTIQAQLQDCTRNQKIFEKVARELNEAGYERTFQQCRDKIKKLKGEYKKIKDKHGKTGEDRSDWDYFDAMDAILGNRPATKPPVVIDTSNPPVTTPDAHEAEQTDDGDPEHDKDSETLSTSSSSTASSVPSTFTSSSVSGSTPLTSRKRKRSAAKPDNGIIEMINSVMKAQSKSDERMLELEEKRLQMEERQFEREAQQRRDDREFQLQMMRLMMGHSMHTSFGLPTNQHNLGQPSSMDQNHQTPPSSFTMDSLYNSYSRSFEDDQ